MKTKELVEEISLNTGLPEKLVDRCLRALSTTVVKILHMGERARIMNIGTIFVEKDKIKFSPSRNLVKRINHPRFSK